MVEQGLSFTLIEAPHPLESDATADKARRNFNVATRVWLGWVPGTDWLHDALEREWGEDTVWYEVKSGRDSIHIGAAGEVAWVVLVLMGAGGVEFARRFGGRLGEASADAMLDWVRQRARRRREETGRVAADPPPDLRERDPQSLADGMGRELADILAVPAERLTLVSAEQVHQLALRAKYRDKQTGVDYEVAVARDSATFTQLGSERG